MMGEGVFGAAVGDIAGSTRENSCGPKEDKLGAPLFPPGSRFTDDTVMTAAVADYLLHRDEGASAAETLRKWGRKYPDAGYGYMFRRWLASDSMGAYGSYGNGSAMRVSPVAYFAGSEEECAFLAVEVTKVTHDHEEGLKGAEVTALCIYKALHGESKEGIAAYAWSRYPRPSEETVRGWLHSERRGPGTCGVTVPQALYCFLESDSFEDCLRNCIAVRADCDTLAAIACSIAEAYYKGVPEPILAKAMGYLPKDIRDTLGAVPRPF
jgi:ADP-ribosylglycohydrolase